MSEEKSSWLNEHTLIGFTDKRGRAWHYRASEQGAESNHYPGEIPIEDIKRRLFYWEPAVGTSESTYTDADGQQVRKLWTGRQTLVHPFTGDRLGEFTDGYVPHSYAQWLVDLAGDIMADNEIGAASAGELKGGRQAWVQFELPDTLDTPQGVAYRPFFLATGSLDGSLSSTYLRGNQLVVCDNTRAGALRDGTALKAKVKHTRNSAGKVKMSDLRKTLEILIQTGDEFAEQIAADCATKVSPAQWDKFLELHCLDGKTLESLDTVRKTNAYFRHRDELDSLWNHDDRVEPWKGTKFGALQAVNTYEHHIKDVARAGRPERNMSKMVAGEFEKLDTATAKQLDLVLAA